MHASPWQATGPILLQVWAYQNHADADGHPEDGGNEGDLGRLPGLVVLRQVRGGRLAGKAVAKEDRLCTANDYQTSGATDACALRGRPPRSIMHCQLGAPLDCYETRGHVGWRQADQGWRHIAVQGLGLTDNQGIEVYNGCDAELHDGVCYGHPHEPQEVHPPEWRCSSTSSFSFG